MSRHIDTPRITAHAEVTIDDFGTTAKDDALVAAAASFFRTWKTSARIVTINGTTRAEIEIRKTFGTKEGEIYARVCIGPITGVIVSWRVESYRDGTMGRIYSKSPVVCFGDCLTIYEAHEAVARRIETLKALPVPSAAEVEARRQQIDEEEIIAEAAVKAMIAGHPAPTTKLAEGSPA